jgi:hypothetical protein
LRNIYIRDAILATYGAATLAAPTTSFPKSQAPFKAPSIETPLSTF